MATKSVTKSITKKKTKNSTPPPSLGNVIVVYTKSSSHSISLIEPTILTLDEIKFVQGIQVTGKVGHRMERKKTFIPCDNIASIIAFDAEEDLWSEPQAKLIRAPEEERQNTFLTSHEQGGRTDQNRQPHGRRRQRNRNRGGGQQGAGDGTGSFDQRNGNQGFRR